MICPDCGKIEVQSATIEYDAEIKHDGQIHKFHIPTLHVGQCAACKEIVFNHITDEQISQALRDYRGLLSPQDIQYQLDVLGLTQKEFAEEIKIAPETVYRWLRGAYIQSCSADQLMRLFFQEEIK